MKGRSQGEEKKEAASRPDRDRRCAWTSFFRSGPELWSRSIDSAIPRGLLCSLPPPANRSPRYVAQSRPPPLADPARLALHICP